MRSSRIRRSNRRAPLAPKISARSLRTNNQMNSAPTNAGLAVKRIPADNQGRKAYVSSRMSS